MDTVSPSKKVSGKGMVWLIAILVVAVVIAFLWWWNYRKYITTDDANLDSFRVSVAAQVMAPMLKQYVWEGDTVKAGRVLAELDSSTVVAELQEAVARREQMIANLKLDKENLNTAIKNLSLAEISYHQAEVNFERDKKLYGKEAVSQETFQNTEDIYKSTRIKVEVAKDQIKVSQAQIAAGEAAIASTNAAIESTRVSLGYYRVIAPVDGVIAKRWSLPGDIIQPGQTLFTINEGKDLWVVVYLEETKYRNIRLGQPADFTLDAFPDFMFSGKIFYIGTNTASEFSLIPPSNASGNYTKVAQRIPLKISVDKAMKKKEKVAMPRLVSGMSATVKIIKEK
ncbi:HlyD family secretion protein [Parabacteroides gordonii]|jgi:membrane fusion protein (multidrug efflux system)|uniref:HlyD family secretion protein n=1 Tax=Parabacteroides gordonii TaxID=574930 RepID=UPI00241C39D0|nr:HlyD family secretion protein [Parabacteroides gordonii]